MNETQRNALDALMTGYKTLDKFLERTIMEAKTETLQKRRGVPCGKKCLLAGPQR